MSQRQITIQYNAPKITAIKVALPLDAPDRIF
jgi:hypothetical protein